MRPTAQMQLILLQPLMPWRHQRLGLGTALLEQVQHPPRPTAAGAALGVAAEGALLVEEAESLLQHGFREAQLGVRRGQIVHQGRGVAVGLQQALEDPAHRQLQAEVLDGGLQEEGPDRLQAGFHGQTARGHRVEGRGSSPELLAQSHFDFQERKATLGFRVGWRGIRDDGGSPSRAATAVTHSANTTPVTAPAAGSSPARFAVLDADLSPEWLALLSGSSAVAVDTEAMGLVHGRDRLCLVQISDGADNVCCIRILRGQSEAPLLKQLMENPAIEKVFHFARFDVAALGEGLGIAVNPLFCTKVASRLARTYTNRHGLKELVQELCAVELDKGAQSSDWGRVEELSETQLAYAANDVRYLLAARDRLVQMLEREERLDLAQRSFACIPVIAELDRGRYGAIFEHRS